MCAFRPLPAGGHSRCAGAGVATGTWEGTLSGRRDPDVRELITSQPLILRRLLKYQIHAFLAHAQVGVEQDDNASLYRSGDRVENDLADDEDDVLNRSSCFFGVVVAFTGICCGVCKLDYKFKDLLTLEDSILERVAGVVALKLTGE